MTSWSALCIHMTAKPSSVSIAGTFCCAKARALVVCLLLIFCCLFSIDGAAANPLARANAAYKRGDYVLVVKLLTPLAFRGAPQAQALLGFMYENGYGAPQAYVRAANLYSQAAIRGNPFGQAMLGLMYDKGHGVPQDFILAYKWLNLAAARSLKQERDYFLRLRNAVASKMSPLQIAEGQRLGMVWAIARR